MIKEIHVCQYCEKMYKTNSNQLSMKDLFDEGTLLEHEKKCFKNPNYHCCYTCKNRKTISHSSGYGGMDTDYDHSCLKHIAIKSFDYHIFDDGRECWEQKEVI